MALMYPSSGPKENDSTHAEPLVYRLLSEQLDDTYHVIHSIPWLSSFTQEVLHDKSNIGEVDFLIIHKELGMLAIEVKGGILKHDNAGFYYSLNSGITSSRTDPVTQLNRGVFALQQWFRESGIEIKIGRAFCFPDSEIPSNALPPGYFDFNHYQKLSLILDKKHIPKFGESIINIMKSHKKNLDSKSLSENQIQKLIDMIIPTSNSSPCWISRVQADNYLWLKLTKEQNECVLDASQRSRFIVNGWPGSGKTIVATHLARNLAKSGLKILILTFNRLLADKLSIELKNHHSACNVYTIFRLSLEIKKDLENRLNYVESTPKTEQVEPHDQYASIVSSLQQAENNGVLAEYDCLIVDEGQVIWQEAWDCLASIFKHKKIMVMCDATQAFDYEKSVSLDWLESKLLVRSYTLTSSLRVPKKVCDRLRIFTKPDYTVHNPRQYEEDTLSELVVPNPKIVLKQIIDKIIAGGIPTHYITVLKPAFLKVPESLVPGGVTIENIGRFRGLESPIVIIFADPKMSNTDFFVAYSRATSKCISIFEAYHVKKGNYGSIGPELYESNLHDIENKINRSFTRSIFNEANLESRIIHKNLPIYWCREWGMYILKADDHTGELIRAIMEVYLRTNSTPEIATWHNESRKTMSLISTDKVDYTRYFTGEVYELQECSSCDIITPHNIQVFNGETCLVCSSEENLTDPSFEKKVKWIGDTLSGKRQSTSEERQNLDPALYIIGAFKKLSSVTFADEVISAVNHPTKAINRIALTYSLFFIFHRLKRNDFDLKIKEVTDLTHTWNSNIEKWAKQSWNAYINDAFRIFELYGIVTSHPGGWRKVNAERVFKNKSPSTK